METALLGFAALFVICFLGFPLGFAMIAVGVGGFAIVRDLGAALGMAAQQAVAVATSYDLSVLPMFVLMGAFIDRANLARELYDACQAWLGHRRGGLAMATIGACGAFAAVSGSSVASAATMAKIAVPEMRRHRYRDSLAAGTVAAGGTLGILIPPSVPMVIFGVLTQTDISKLFIAGILPGLLLIALYFCAIGVQVRLDAEAGPRTARTNWAQRWILIPRVWGVGVLFVVVLGSMYFGICTPTEAAAIGASGAFLFALARGRLDRRGFAHALVDAGLTTATILTVVIGALVFSNFLTLTRAPFDLVTWIQALDPSPIGALLAISAIYLVLGCIFETLGMLLLTVPLFFPVVKALGIDPVWFGIIVVIALELGLITPPVGMNVFVVKSVVPEVALGTIFRGIWPFVGADIACLLLVVFVPAIALLLPNWMN
jgi:tripartite ATP-independent transporter DctM subunit